MSHLEKAVLIIARIEEARAELHELRDQMKVAIHDSDLMSTMSEKAKDVLRTFGATSEELYGSKTGGDVASPLALCEQAKEENQNLQLLVSELRAAVDSMKRLEAQRYQSTANAFGLTPPSERTRP